MSPSYPSEIISSQRVQESVAVPAKWRTGQIALVVMVALVALWYATMGFRSPSPESGNRDSFSFFELGGFIVAAGMIWLTTPATWTIASTTFQEAIRRRWMTALLGFALVMLAVSTFFTWMQPGEQQKFLRDFGVGFTAIMTLIVAVFLGVALVPPEVDRRTIFTILSKPVNRQEFLLGKYLGLCMVLALNLALMSILFLLAYALFLVRQEGGLQNALAVDNAGVAKLGLVFELSNQARALGLQFGLVCVVGAVALTLSQFMANMTAIISTFVVYFLGQSASYWEQLTGQADKAGPTLGPIITTVVNALYAVLPRLDRFDVRERIVNDLPVHLNYILKADAAGLTYIAALLALAYFVFGDREF